MLALLPLSGLAGLGLWVAVAAGVGYASVASVTAALALPLLGALGGARGAELGLLGALSAVVLVRHRQNVSRLRRGLEPRLRPRPRSAS